MNLYGISFKTVANCFHPLGFDILFRSNALIKSLAPQALARAPSTRGGERVISHASLILLFCTGTGVYTLLIGQNSSGQNGMDKMVYWQNGMGKLVWTKWYRLNGTDKLLRIKSSIYPRSEKH